MDPVRFHFLNSDVVIELFFVHKNHSRAYWSVLHLVSMFARSQPPCSLGDVAWSQVHERLHLARWTRCTQLSVVARAPWWVGEFVPDTKFSWEDIGVHTVFVVRGRGFEQSIPDRPARSSVAIPTELPGYYERVPKLNNESKCHCKKKWSPIQSSCMQFVLKLKN